MIYIDVEDAQDAQDRYDDAKAELAGAVANGELTEAEANAILANL